jgi:processive 1,2-diacylglycerol beta-glucosyltransferase
VKKVLIFPLLDSLPSGHHQVAHTITEYIHNRSNDVECKTIDLMKHWSPLLEPLLTKTYLWWIQQYPRSYAWVYRQFAYQSRKQRSYKHYEILFLHKMKEILAEEQPDLLICTHAFPSYFINKLKGTGVCTVPSLNIYTDFFINDVWGREKMDYHFVPDTCMKSSLVGNYSVPESNIFITGIPVDESFTNTPHLHRTNRAFNIILSGGSTGLGKIMEIINQSRHDHRINFYILCGSNKQLFHEISKLNEPNLHPLPYVSSRREMNELYNLADAIITKPGGVTVSEALRKRVPIFIHSALPGQEEINLIRLKEQGLVFTITEGVDIADQVVRTLNDESTMMEYQLSLQRYMRTQDMNDPEEIFLFIKSLVGRRSS